MEKREIKYTWHKQTVAEDIEIVDCLDYDPIKDFTMDPSGCYVLIRINRSQGLIEVAICDKEHRIMKVFRGGKSQDIYHAIFQAEKDNAVEWFKSKEHIAYLGKELKKAEYALSGKEEYWQE